MLGLLVALSGRESYDRYWEYIDLCMRPYCVARRVSDALEGSVGSVTFVVGESSFQWLPRKGYLWVRSMLCSDSGDVRSQLKDLEERGCCIVTKQTFKNSLLSHIQPKNICLMH